MRKIEQSGYFVDARHPRHPIHAKLAHAARRGLIAITQLQANALSAALRGQPPPLPDSVLPRVPAIWKIPELLAKASQATPDPALEPMPEPEAPPPAIELPHPLPDLPPDEPPKPLFEEALDDAAARRAARARIMGAAQAQAFYSADDQMEYEVALMAHNKNVESMAMLEPRARQAGVAVEMFAEQIIMARRAKERRLMRVRAVEEHYLAALNDAAGEAIGALEAEAVAKIDGTTA